MKERIKEIDYIKAIGIILVIYGHMISLDDNKLAYESDVFRFIYLFHMPLFFVVSGIPKGIINKCSNDKKATVQKLFKRLMVPYFVWSVIYIILSVGVHFRDWREIVPERVWAVVSCRGVAPLWFLAALFISNVIFEYLQPFLDNRNILKGYVPVIMTAICAILTNVGYKQLNVETLLISYPLVALCRVPVSLFFIMVGYKIGMHWKSICTLKLPVLLICAAFCTGVLVVTTILYEKSFNFHTFEIPVMSLYMTTGIVGTFMIVLLAIALGKAKKLRFLAEVGEASLDIMCLHYPPFPLIKVLLLCTHFCGWHMNPILTIVVLLLCFIISKYGLNRLRSMKRKPV